MSQQVEGKVAQLAKRLLAENSRVCTAESCTGGLIAKTLTARAGSSQWFDRGFVTYSNQSKTDMLSVSASIIDEYGAVSEAVAVAMATGALRHSEAAYAIAVTGIAGPGGGSMEKPVGTVWLAVASHHHCEAIRYQFDGDRETIREATLVCAVEKLLAVLTNPRLLRA